ncbi:hypothetical protein [Nocardia tengchongensis]|uniref:hypothetical protein n=1 Tax=Nocardia tengchongensis TaxID=2055889 RepID=UPI00361B3759
MTSSPPDRPVLVSRSTLTSDDRAEADRWLDQPSVRKGLGMLPASSPIACGESRISRARCGFFSGANESAEAGPRERPGSDSLEGGSEPQHDHLAKVAADDL